jgi:hypothetical protein
MLKHPAVTAFAAAALLAVPLQALPYGENWHNRHSHGPEKRLVEKYDRFAGSDENARELVTGLRNDSQIDLSKNGKTTTFKPATDEMGYGNVDIALALAKASLANHGIHNPTPEQIKAALNGGRVTTKSGQRVTLPGVLKLRASGMGWGQIAQKVGVKLGDVKRHGHAHKKHDGKHHDKHARHHDRDDDDDGRHHRKHVKHEHKHDKHHDRDRGDRHERKHEEVKHYQHQRPEFHRAKFERPERVHRPEKIERPHRPERPERHHHRR